MKVLIFSVMAMVLLSYDYSHAEVSCSVSGGYGINCDDGDHMSWNENTAEDCAQSAFAISESMGWTWVDSSSAEYQESNAGPGWRVSGPEQGAYKYGRCISFEDVFGSIPF